MAHISRAHIDITGKCNLNCKHCHMSKYHSKQPSLKEILSIINNLKDIGVDRIALSGGEPFIREDLFEILEECPKNISILSNGSMITEEILKRLKEFENKTSSIITLRISLDGIKSHEKIRNYPSEKIINILKKIRELDFISVVNTTTSPYLEEGELIEMLKTLESIKIDQWNIDIPFNEGNFKENKMQLNLNFLSLEFEKLIKEYHNKDYNIRLDIVGLYSSERFKEDKIFAECDLNTHPCSYQFPSITINPLGEIQLCPSLHLSFGNIKDLKTYRNTEKWEKFSSKNRFYPKGCALCRYIRICGGGCRANSLCSNNDPWGKDKLSCFLMKLLEFKILPLYSKEIQKQFKELICKFKIRDYTIEDSKNIIKLFKIIYPNWSNEELSRVTYDPKNERHISTKIMTLNNEIVGQINAFKLRDKEFANIGYHVHPKYQRRGIAKELLKKIKKDLKKNKIKYLIIRTDKENLPSISFAKNQNFIKINKNQIKKLNLEYLEKTNQVIFIKEIT